MCKKNEISSPEQIVITYSRKIEKGPLHSIKNGIYFLISSILFCIKKLLFSVDNAALLICGLKWNLKTKRNKGY